MSKVHQHADEIMDQKKTFWFVTSDISGDGVIHCPGEKVGRRNMPTMSEDDIRSAISVPVWMSSDNAKFVLDPRLERGIAIILGETTPDPVYTWISWDEYYRHGLRILADPRKGVGTREFRKMYSSGTISTVGQAAPAVVELYANLAEDVLVAKCLSAS